MNNKLGLLGGLVALQLVLIAAFWFGGGADSTPGELLDFAPEAVDELSISDQESELVLVREEAGWQVGALPADDTKIDELLQKMSALAAPWPVAQSAASAARFEVQKDNFQRRVVLRGGTDVIADLYLGTSPGYQRVHARRTDSDDVYSIGLSNFELAVGVDNWLDKGLLALEDAPARVVLEYAAEEMSPQTLERRAAGEDESDTWLINGMPAAQDAATTYANRFVNLQVLGVAGDEQVAQAVRVATISTGTADVSALTVLRIGDDGDYLLQSEAHQGVFRVATYIAEQLLMKDVDLEDATEAAPDEVQEAEALEEAEQLE